MASMHYAHYEDFIKRLQVDPDISFQDYCRQNESVSTDFTTHPSGNTATAFQTDGARQSPQKKYEQTNK